MDLSKAFLTCLFCGGRFQALQNGVYDAEATRDIFDTHRNTCTAETPYLNDPHATYEEE